MSLELIYKEILEIDPKIRYVGIYHKGNLSGKMREGVKSYLDETETKLSLNNAVKRWEGRKDSTPKIGRPIYSLTMYEKVKTITIEATEGVIILLSTELECEHVQILEELLDMKKEILEMMSKLVDDPKEFKELIKKYKENQD